MIETEPRAIRAVFNTIKEVNMIDKIKNDLSRITWVLSVVVAALLAPTILARLQDSLTEAALVALIEYGLLVAAATVLIVAKENAKQALPVSHTLFYAALAFVHVYNAIAGSLAAYATAGLYAAVAVLFFIPACKKAFQLTSLIAIAFFLASALGGGAVNLSILLFALVLAANNYFDSEKE